jgi:hypothetical protein
MVNELKKIGINDTYVLVTSERPGLELVGPGGEDIGAYNGWHVLAEDRYSVLWDIFGEHPAQAYQTAILARNNVGLGSWQEFTTSDTLWNAIDAFVGSGH